MIIVSCKGNKIEAALKKYRHQVDRIRQLSELRSRKEFEKPSVKKRKVKAYAKYKNKL